MPGPSAFLCYCKYAITQMIPVLVHATEKDEKNEQQCAKHYQNVYLMGSRRNHLSRVTKSYLLALGTTQVSSFFTKH